MILILDEPINVSWNLSEVWKLAQPARKWNMSCHLSTYLFTLHLGSKYSFHIPLQNPWKSSNFSATFLPAFSIRYSSSLHAEIPWACLLFGSVHAPAPTTAHIQTASKQWPYQLGHIGSMAVLINGIISRNKNCIVFRGLNFPNELVFLKKCPNRNISNCPSAH